MNAGYIYIYMYHIIFLPVSNQRDWGQCCCYGEDTCWPWSQFTQVIRTNKLVSLKSGNHFLLVQFVLFHSFDSGAYSCQAEDAKILRICYHCYRTNIECGAIEGFTPSIIIIFLYFSSSYFFGVNGTFFSFFLQFHAHSWFFD